MSWIALEDLVGVFKFVLCTPSLVGPVNGVAPGAVTNSEFTRTFGLRAALGDMAREMLLSGQRVLPRRLLEAGYEFAYPDLVDALKHAVSR
jgi:NAD dependent epimerase/dehydratase family enzyme